MAILGLAHELYNQSWDIFSIVFFSFLVGGGLIWKDCCVIPVIPDGENIHFVLKNLPFCIIMEEHFIFPNVKLLTSEVRYNYAFVCEMVSSIVLPLS